MQGCRRGSSILFVDRTVTVSMHGIDFLFIRDCHYNHLETIILTIRLLSSQICFYYCYCYYCYCYYHSHCCSHCHFTVTITVIVIVTVTIKEICSYIEASINEIVMHIIQGLFLPRWQEIYTAHPCFGPLPGALFNQCEIQLMESLCGIDQSLSFPAQIVSKGPQYTHPIQAEP